MAYTPVVGTLAYVRRGGDVLMVHRSFKDADPALGKYNGLGGKLEPDEDVVAGLRRELREEAGIEISAWRLRGTVSWPGFGADGESVLAFVFVVDAFTGEPPAANDEGTLHWIPQAELAGLPLWEGDHHWLGLVFDETVAQFHGVMPYADGRPADWQVSILPA